MGPLRLSRKVIFLGIFSFIGENGWLTSGFGGFTGAFCFLTGTEEIQHWYTLFAQ